MTISDTALMSNRLRLGHHFLISLQQAPSNKENAMSIRGDIIRLGQELSEQDNEAYNLWTRLPSHKAAEQAHGEHAGNFTPPVSDVLKEAALFISHGLDPTIEQFNEAGDFYACPCGEDHQF